MSPRIFILLVPMICAGCGTFRLGYVTTAAPGKTVDQVKLDNLICKDKARLEAESAGNQVGDFVLGLTIIGTPIAYAHDRQVQRDTWSACMREAGYTVAPPKPEEM